MSKSNIQESNYIQRERNFLSTVVSDDTFQVIVGNDGSDVLLLWQDEYYMEAYLKSCSKPILLSKVDTIIFLKWVKAETQIFSFSIHPVFGSNNVLLQPMEVLNKIIDKMESDGDFFDTLRENNLL
ncbi:hypothetical protein GCM10027051_29490 [Niabella terrae]